MGNLSITPAIPAADGTGLPSSVASLGLEKTIYIDGTFTGAVTVEASNGKGYVPVATLTAPGRQTLKFAAQDIRVVRSAATAIPGTPAVTVSGNDDGAQFAELAVGTPGASSDLKAFGTQNTVMVDIGVNELTLSGVAVNGETVVIGGKTYTFQTVLTDVDGNVLIGTGQAESIANLIAAVNLGAGAGSTYATSMTANTDVAANAGSTTSIMEAKLLNGSGSLRGVATTETLSNGAWGATTIGKSLDGVVQIQTSEDDATWTDLCAFQTPGHQTVEVVARYVRVNHVNNVLGSTPTVAIAAVNDDTAHRPVQVLTSSALITMDGGAGDVHTVVLDINTTIANPINVEVGQVLQLIVTQDGVGSKTTTWGSAWEWNGGVQHVASLGANAKDLIRGVVTAVSATGVATEILAESVGKAFAV